MSGFFDETYYLKHKADQLAKTGVNDANGKPYTPDTLKAMLNGLGITPEDHYKAYGRTEKLNPNPYFNEAEYLAAKKAVLAESDPSWATKSIDDLRAAIEATGLNPAEHYEKFGAFESNSKGVLINPSNAFDANAYFAAKLVELKAAGVAGAETMKVADVIAAFKDAGISPVTHYESFGAKEATTNNIPLIQTVPSEQRVANDPARVENVPGNYNPPTVGAASPEAAPVPVVKPADVGAKVPAAVSPPVVPPTKPLPVPGDSGYVAPPANIVDTNTKPVVPPSSATGDNWAQVNPDGSADLIKPDGNPGGTLPPGSLNPADPSNPAPVVPPAPDVPGGGGGGVIPFNLTLTQDPEGNITITGTTGSEPVDPLNQKYVYFSEKGTVQVASKDVPVTLKEGMTIDASAVTGNNPLGIYTNSSNFPLDILGSSTISNSISAIATSSITAGPKNDVVTISGTADATGTIDLGAGADTLSVDSKYFADIVNLSGDGSRIKGLSDSGDSVIIGGSFSGLPVAKNTDVKSAGQWHYNASDDILTYYNGTGAVALTMPVDGYVGVTTYGLTWQVGADPSGGLEASTSGTTLTLTGNPKQVSRVIVTNDAYVLNNGYDADTSVTYNVTDINASGVGTAGGNAFILSTKDMTDPHTVQGSKQVVNNVTLGTGVSEYTGHSGGVGGDQVTLGSGDYAGTLKFGGGSALVMVSGTDNATVAKITADSTTGKEFTLGLETGSNSASTITATIVTTGDGNDKVMLYEGAKIETLHMGAGEDTLVFYTREKAHAFTASTVLTGVETIEIDAAQESNPSLDLSGVTTADVQFLTIIGDNANNKIICPQFSTYVKTKENTSADNEQDLVIGGNGVDSIDFGSTTTSAATSSNLWAYTEKQSIKTNMNSQHPHITESDWAKHPVAKASDILFGSAGNDHIMCKGAQNDVFVYQVDTDATPALGAEYKSTAAAFGTDTIYGFTLTEDFLTIVYGAGGADKVAESIWKSGVSGVDGNKTGYINFGSGASAGTSESHHATYTLTNETTNKGNAALSDYKLVITFDSTSNSTDTLTLNLVDVVGTLSSLSDLVYEYK